MIMKTTSPATERAGGLLLAAFRDGKTEPLSWIDLPVGDLLVTVATDAMKARTRDRNGVRLPVTYIEVVELCRALGCITPTKEIADAMFSLANSQLNFVPLVRTASDSAKMMNLDFTMKFHEGVEQQLKGKDPAAQGLIFGAWKLWILHPRIVERGAINYGFWDKSKRPPAPIQTVGGQHDAAHYDYSQVFQPVKRMAKHRQTGESVDLVEYFAQKNKIPEKYLEPYTLAPGTALESFAEPDSERDLFEILAAGGVNVEAMPGWKSKGRPDFKPIGIMLHHTAGPKSGESPSLKTCLDGRPGLSGPLCHIVLGRSGKAYVLAANRCNHAGDGSRPVLEKVKKDEPVVGNAATNGYKDEPGLSGNGYFYGIEVENSGVGEAYPDAQIDALGRICAALCQAHGWSANRVVHHRQWTIRKADMSYKGDIPGLVGQIMDTGTPHFGVSFSEEDEAPFPPGVEANSPQEEQDEPATNAAR